MKIKNMKTLSMVFTYNNIKNGDMFILEGSKSGGAPYIKQSYRMATNIFLGIQEKRSLEDRVQIVLSFEYKRS